MAVDPLFPYAAFPPPSDAPTGRLDRSRVRYPTGMFDQLPYRPYRPIQRKPVVQSPPPEPKTVPATDCPQCEACGIPALMAWIQPGFWLCNRCGFRRTPK
ncbi:MAG: hypothetical protein ACLP9L_01230 [Thermoguttaceae bacterium]